MDTWQRSLRGVWEVLRLQYELARAAARQAPARGLGIRDAVGDELRLAAGRRQLVLHLVDEVVLDATAGNRAHDLPVVANGDHRADGTGGRAPSPDDGAERHTPAAFAPTFGRAQYFDVYAIHGEMLAQLCSPARRVRRQIRSARRAPRQSP